MFGHVPVEGKHTVCLVSGGNIDVNFLSRIISRGLLKSGRQCTLVLELPDKPGQLLEVVQVISSTGANIISSLHERTAAVANVNSCYLRISMETRDHAHVDEIKKALNQKGFKVVE